MGLSKLWAQSKDEGELRPMQAENKSSIQEETLLCHDAVKQIGVVLEKVKPIQRDAILRACLSLNLPEMKAQNLDPKPF